MSTNNKDQSHITPFWLPSFSVRRPVTVIMIYLALLTLSIVSMTRMKLDMFPDVSFPTITVITQYQGAGAREVEQQITKPIESQLSIVRNLDQLTSKSSEGLSIVQLKFKWGIDLDNAANDVRDRLGLIKRYIPEEADDPMIMRFDMQDMPILFVGATAKETFAKLYDLLDKDVSDMLKRINGVGNVMVNGGISRQINIDVDRQKLESRGLTLMTLKASLRRNNLMTAAGDIKIGDIKYLLRVPGEFENVDEIKEAPIGMYQGNVVKMKDVAHVLDSSPEESDRVCINGERGAVLIIQKRSGANIVEVSNAVMKALPGIQGKLPKDVKLEILIDGADDVRRTLKNLSDTLWIAVILIFGIILFFVRQLRPAVIVFTSIPVSLVDSFMLQYLFGYTVNMISLLAITIAVGLVVDDALVVMENQVRHMEEFGSSPKEAAINATSQVGRAVTVSTLTSCIVFLPMIFATGIAGIFFKQLAVVIVVT
ncbi:MAG: efflux RND transporter permease subunit, partial [Candidatus Aureabacteria bacterium]|nr:efflux RND transporter permease subunit [Candidatus Auribacterota bacterium]